MIEPISIKTKKVTLRKLSIIDDHKFISKIIVLDVDVDGEPGRVRATVAPESLFYSPEDTLEVLAKLLDRKIAERFGIKPMLASTIMLLLTASYNGSPAPYTLPHTFMMFDSPLSNHNAEYHADAFNKGFGGVNPLSTSSAALPGVSENVPPPCTCNPAPTKLWSLIQHLNDAHKWTRESIADWLDELHDSGRVNIEFQVDLDKEEV